MKNNHLRRIRLWLIASTSLWAMLGGAAQAQDGMKDPVLDVNHLDRFAWELFVRINRPANDGTRNVIWETWASSDDIFADPNKVPVWPSQGTETKKLSPNLRQQDAFREFMRQRLAPGTAAPEFHPSGIGGNEVRMNRPAFDYVVANELYHLDGQEKAFRDGKKIDLPVLAKEIKASWKEIREADKPRYHWQPYQGKIYGLIALHITTKDVPQWFWCTFEHVDNPRRGAVVPSVDAFGLKADGSISEALGALYQEAGLGDTWKNYRLNGSQINFTDTQGRPTILANSIIEDGFEAASSCVTCHAMATVDSGGGRLSFFPPQTGTPDPAWFEDTTVTPAQRRFIQLDFVWSFFRAGRKNP